MRGQEKLLREFLSDKSGRTNNRYLHFIDLTTRHFL